MTQPTEAPNKHRDRFVRWQGITITQFGYAINLILTFATAALGFSIALVRDKEFRELLPQHCGKWLLIGVLISFAASIVAGLLCVLNRLRDFRTTAQIARRRQKLETGTDSAQTDAELDKASEEAGELGEQTWKFFWTQVVTFGIGMVGLCLVVALVYLPKLP